MSIYSRFCRETVGKNGSLESIDIFYPENFNFGYDVVDELAATEPDSRAIVWCSAEGEEHTFSFADVSRESSRAANALVHAGIRRGDRVIVALKRHYEYWFTAVALHKIGAIMVPVTHMLTEDDLLYRINAAEVSAVICTPQNGVPQRVQEAVRRSGRSVMLWSVQKGAEGFMNLTEAMRCEKDTFERMPTLAHDPMVIYFTSGTTGEPKGVIHDFSYPLAHIVTAKYWQRAEEGGLHFTVAETGWAKASWGKIYGQWLVGSAVMVYDFDSFDPRKLAEVINRYGVTSFCAPPTIYRYLVRKGVPATRSLRHAATAGEFLSPDVFHSFTEATGLALMEGYGQTETTLLMANFAGAVPRDGSMGKPSPLYQVELRLADGSPAPVGEIGEIVVVPKDGETPIGVFKGYLGSDELYEKVWSGGVYHTGDAAWMDGDGYFWFHGRFDDIIKSGGFRIGPHEVENILLEHKAVLECSVVGVPDELRGQAIKAIVVLAPGYQASHELELELREFCNSRLADYKWVRIIEFVDELPKTISGKVRRAVLRER